MEISSLHLLCEGQVKCLAMQLLSALAAVHENFILHRDLKQTNLLLDKNGACPSCVVCKHMRRKLLPHASESRFVDSE